MNLVNPFWRNTHLPRVGGHGGVLCVWGRTGGSVIIYGSMYIILGLFLASGFHNLVQAFPLPVLGVILMVEGFLSSFDQGCGRRPERFYHYLVGGRYRLWPALWLCGFAGSGHGRLLPSLSLNALSNLGPKATG